MSKFEDYHDDQGILWTSDAFCRKFSIEGGVLQMLRWGGTSGFPEELRGRVYLMEQLQDQVIKRIEKADESF